MSLALAGTVWGGCANSYNSLLGARILQGLSVATFESVIFSVVGDLYYVHERGVRVAGVTAVMAGLSNLPPILAGKIATTLSWRWVFWLLAIFVGIGLGLVILVGWETAFNRGAIFNLDLTSQDVSQETGWFTDTNPNDFRRTWTPLTRRWWRATQRSFNTLRIPRAKRRTLRREYQRKKPSEQPSAIQLNERH
jgi:MFS family permease